MFSHNPRWPIKHSSISDFVANSATKNLSPPGFNNNPRGFPHAGRRADEIVLICRTEGDNTLPTSAHLEWTEISSAPSSSTTVVASVAVNYKRPSSLRHDPRIRSPPSWKESKIPPSLIRSPLPRRTPPPPCHHQHIP
jgi:hypothetical protein